MTIQVVAEAVAQANLVELWVQLEVNFRLAEIVQMDNLDKQEV